MTPTSPTSPEHHAAPEQRPLVAISACLLGQSVRYDGAHKRQELIIEQLEPWLEWLPLCPEVAAGLGIPRPPVQLVNNGKRKLALGVKDHELDVTDALEAASTRLAGQLQRESGLCGVILKSRSPSCGLGSTPLYNDARQPIGLDSGVFASTLKTLDYPCVEESWLNSPERCRRFLLACLLYRKFNRSAINQDRNHWAPVLEQWSEDKVEEQLDTLTHSIQIGQNS